jgi:adenosine deaminase
LAELHLHQHGGVRPVDLLEYLAGCERLHWDWYESGFEAVYGYVPPTRELVRRFRDGDLSVIPAFIDLYVVSDADAGSFARFGAKGNLNWAGTDYTPGGLEREVLAFAALVGADLTAQGITHVEYRTSAEPGLLEAFARDRGPLTQRAVVTPPRDDPWPVWEQVKELALGPFGRALTAIDFSGVEEGHPPKTLRELFRDVRAFNGSYPERAIAILDHVGESFEDKTLESAVRWVQEAAEFGAHRLGHAIALGIEPAVYGEHVRRESVAERRDQIRYDLANLVGLIAAGVSLSRDALIAEEGSLASQPADAVLTQHYDWERLEGVRRRQAFAMARVRTTGAVIEVCPTSNRRIAGIADPRHHPVHRFIAADLPVVISTDNPGVFDTTLADELDWVCQHTGGGDELRRRLLETAWRSRAECLSGRLDP